MVFFASKGLGSLYNPSEKPKKRIIYIITCLISSGVFFMLGAYFFKYNATPSDHELSQSQLGPSTAQSVASLADSFFDARLQTYDEIRRGESLSSSLRRMGVSSAEAELLIRALGPQINMRTIKPGNVLMVENANPHVQLRALGSVPSTNDVFAPKAVEIFSHDEHGLAFSIRAAFDQEEAKKVQININKTNVYKEHRIINGLVSNSLYAAIINNGGDAQLVNTFSEVFSWQFDFFRESREGDSYQMVVERNVADGRFVGFGKVMAAEYTNGSKTLRGFYFASKDGQIAGFFDDKGQSLKNAFLKTPLKLANITSGFNKRRFHPVQKRIKAHNGVDYGANIGAPVRAVASGTVVNAGYSPFNGNWVRIKHMNGYETEYLHANRLAKNIRVGARVQQGQHICDVGKTGLATGPHLHFGMKKDGIYVDPTKQHFARSMGVPTRYMKEFASNIEAMVIALNRQAPKTNAIAMTIGPDAS
jgi:murein DD-endopeptidase MepM/ murein hydrolase activator NlpD